MLVSRGGLKARAARSCAGSALWGEPRARRAGRAFVVVLVGHLEHLFPQGPSLVPLAGGVERSGQRVGGAVVGRGGCTGRRGPPASRSASPRSPAARAPSRRCYCPGRPRPTAAFSPTPRAL